MSIPYEQSGRARQKQRTRAALVAAARELVVQGQTPTVDDAASQASISRTTAYRYFPNQRALLVAAHPEIEARSLLPEKAPSDVPGRLDAVVAAFLDVIVDTEAQQRTMLRLSLDPDPSHRGEHRGSRVADRYRRPLTQRGGPTHAVVCGGTASVRVGRCRRGRASKAAGGKSKGNLSATEPVMTLHAD